jgi:hypothetical protein
VRCRPAVTGRALTPGRGLLRGGAGAVGEGPRRAVPPDQGFATIASVPSARGLRPGVPVRVSDTCAATTSATVSTRSRGRQCRGLLALSSRGRHNGRLERRRQGGQREHRPSRDRGPAAARGERRLSAFRPALFSGGLASRQALRAVVPNHCAEGSSGWYEGVMNERATELLERHPWRVAGVTAVLTLIVVHSAIRAGASSNLEHWPAYLAFGLVAWAVLSFALTFKSPALAGPQPALVRWALAYAPAIVGSFVPLAGGQQWVAWAALGICDLLLLTFAIAASSAGRAKHRQTATPPDRS